MSAMSQQHVERTQCELVGIGLVHRIQQVKTSYAACMRFRYVIRNAVEYAAPTEAYCSRRSALHFILLRTDLRIYCTCKQDTRCLLLRESRAVRTSIQEVLEAYERRKDTPKIQSCTLYIVIRY